MILGAHVSTAGGVSNAPLNAHKLGIAAFQIFTKNQNRWTAKPLDPVEIDRFLANCERCGIRITVAHDAYLINLCAVDRSKLALSRKAFLDEMVRADQLQIPFLVMHPGSHLKAGEEVGIKLIAESLRMLIDQHSGGRVRVLLETTAGQGTNLGYRFEQLAEMLRLIDCPERTGVCIDTCHIFAAGYDFRTYPQYEEIIADFDRVIGLDRLFCFHFNDSKREPGSRIDRHQHIGEGLIGREPFGYFLKDRRFEDLPAILETPGEMDNFVNNLAVLRALEE
mgnify:CR=1 FL=1